MSKKLTIDEMLRLACIYAENDRIAWLSSIDKCEGEYYEKERTETLLFIDAVRTYRIKRWGRTKQDARLQSAKTVNILDLLKRI